MPRKESKKRHTTAPPKANRTPSTVNKSKKPTVAKKASRPAEVAVTHPVATPAPAVVDRGTIDGLIESLRRWDADAAREAATALGSYNDPAATDALITALTDTNGYFHSVVRSAAAASLGQIGDRRAVPALISTVRDGMAEASAEAVRALASLNDDRAVLALIHVVRNADGFFLPVVRLAAVHALATFAHDDAHNELSRVAGDVHEDSVIRQAAQGR
jgi:HEAT repeat protein